MKGEREEEGEEERGRRRTGGDERWMGNGEEKGRECEKAIGKGKEGKN